MGDAEGEADGDVLGLADGELVGELVGDLVGELVGELVGDLVGELVGACVGAYVGFTVGAAVGFTVSAYRTTCVHPSVSLHFSLQKSFSFAVTSPKSRSDRPVTLSNVIRYERDPRSHVFCAFWTFDPALVTSVNLVIVVPPHENPRSQALHSVLPGAGAKLPRLHDEQAVAPTKAYFP